MAVEFYQEFSDWLTANGHRAWSDQLFTARLREHSELVGYELEKKAVHSNKTTQQTLSRRPGGYAMASPGGQYTAWFGIRFRPNGQHRSDDGE